MKGRPGSIALWVLVVVLLAGCGSQVGPIRLPPRPAPAVDVPESSCDVDEDCVHAFRLDRCCDCGAIYSRQYVDADPRLLLYRERWEVDYPVPRVIPAACWGIHCAPCPGPFRAVCADKMCRAPDTWDKDD
jgi:hypothetical protein